MPSPGPRDLGRLCPHPALIAGPFGVGARDPQLFYGQIFPVEGAVAVSCKPKAERWRSLCSCPLAAASLWERFTPTSLRAELLLAGEGPWAQRTPQNVHSGDLFARGAGHLQPCWLNEQDVQWGLCGPTVLTILLCF